MSCKCVILATYDNYSIDTALSCYAVLSERVTVIGTIMMSGSGILTNGKGTRREYGEFNLDELQASVCTNAREINIQYIICFFCSYLLIMPDSSRYTLYSNS